MLMTIVILLTLFLRIAITIVTIHSFECTPSTELCPSVTCNTKQSRHKAVLINCGCWLARPMYNLTGGLTLQRRNGNRYETFVTLKGNLCDLVTRNNRQQGLSRVFQSIKDHFNKFSCPFYGNVSVSNVPLSLSMAPGFLPPSRYKLSCYFSDSGDFVMDVQIKFSIGAKKFKAG